MLTPRRQGDQRKSNLIDRSGKPGGWGVLWTSKEQSLRGKGGVSERAETGPRKRATDAYPNSANRASLLSLRKQFGAQGWDKILFLKES